MASSDWYLILSVIGAGFTLVALRPPRRPQFLMGITFFAAWLTTELAAWFLAFQVLITLGFVAAGALSEWTGWLGLAITLASWVGLGYIVHSARRTAQVFSAAFDEGLGQGWGDAFDPNWAPGTQHFEWRRVVLPFSFRRAGVERTRGLDYVGDGAKRHRLDIYKRADAGPGAPVLLQIHGGAWVIGGKEQQGLPLMYHLAARGWICVAINYRLSPKATWPAQLLDCQAALAWVRANIAQHGGDPNYVVVTGGSAGGHLTALTALTDGHVRAMVPFYGVYDWTNRFDQRGRNDGMRKMLARLVVKQPFDAARDVYEDASPMNHITDSAPPALVVHGTLDTLAPVAEAREFVRMLRAVSHKPVVYAELPGAHHAFEVFQSIRTMHTVAAVDLFLTWLLTHDPPRAVAELAADQSSERLGR